MTMGVNAADLLGMRWVQLHLPTEEERWNETREKAKKTFNQGLILILTSLCYGACEPN